MTGPVAIQALSVGWLNPDSWLILLGDVSDGTLSAMEDPYVPDVQDRLVGEALDLGGSESAQEAQFTATEIAQAVVPWDSTGQEPPEYTAAWLAALWATVAARRGCLTPLERPPGQRGRHGRDQRQDHQAHPRFPRAGKYSH